jgi:hypothetical protein
MVRLKLRALYKRLDVMLITDAVDSKNARFFPMLMSLKLEAHSLLPNI